MKRPKRRDGFTLIELLVVIAIIAILASLVVGLSGTAGRKATESRVKAELAAIETAIEAYKQKFGHYPPDNPDTPILNGLYYELTGALYSPTRRTFRDPMTGNIMDPKLIKELLGVEGFVNASKTEGELKKFYEPRPENVRHLSEDHDEDDGGHGHKNHHSDELHILCVPSPWPLSRDDHPVRYRGEAAKAINPWRYVSGGPVNNVQQYDLWAEYVEGDEVWVISNWKSEPFPKAQLSRYYKKKLR